MSPQIGVLIVGRDEAAWNAALAEELAVPSICATAAGNRDAALRLLRSAADQADLIIVDLDLPGAEGVEAVRAIG